MRFFKIKFKTTVFFALVVVSFCFLGFNALGNNDSTKVQNAPLLKDTVEVNRLMKEGSSLEYLAPDSASFCYREALKILKALPSTSFHQKLTANCYIRLASIYNLSGNYKLSGKYDSLAMNIGQRLDDKNILGQCTNIKGLLYFNQSDYPNALANYAKALEYATMAGNKRLEAMIYTNSAIIHFYKGEFQKADSFFNKTINTAIEMQDTLLISGSYINRGMLAQHTGNIAAAVDYYTKAAEMSLLNHDESSVILCKQNIGSLLHNNGQELEALDAFTESLQLALKQNDLANIAKGYHNLGEVYASLGDLETAIDYYLQAAGIKEKLNDLQGLASIYTGIGNLKYQRGDYEAARNDYNESLEINLKLDYQKGIAKDYLNLANVYRQQRDWETGLGFAAKSLQIHQSIQLEEDIDELYTILGSLHSGNKDYKNAEKYLHLALEKALVHGDTLQQATVQNEFAGMFLKQAKENNDRTLYAEAINRGESVLKMLEGKQALIIRNETLGLLEEAYTKNGNLTKALWASREARLVADSLLNREKSKYTILAEAKWKAGQHKAKVEKLEESERQKDRLIEQQAKEDKLQHLVIYLLVIIGILLLAALLFFMLYIRKKKDEFYHKQVRQVTTLRMKNIRNRVSSHFFFNVLSLVSSKDTGQMKQMLRNLAFLFRKSVENIDQLAISIEEELSLVKAYIDLQRLTMSDQFQVQISVDDDVDPLIQIPAMLIQIPVENAIKHGLMPLAGSQELHVSISKTDKQVHIQISDNGIGFTKSAGRSTGTGTGLKVLYEIINLLNTRNEDKIVICIDEEGFCSENTTGARIRFAVPINYQFEIFKR